MSLQLIGLLGVGGLVLLMLLRVPVAIALMIVGLLGYIGIDSMTSALVVMGSTPLQIATEYTLSVVPLFTLMGILCASMGLSSKLYDAAAACFGRVRGSSALATIGASAAFGAMNGSSLATCATIGKIAVPEMREQGYRDTLIAGSIAAGGTLGILIPPSIIMVVYALITEQSIARLFAAGMIPGVVLACLYFGAVAVTLLFDRDAAPRGRALTLRQRLAALTGAWEAALLFGGTIGGIYAGIFTPTEAASVGVAMALVIGFARGNLTLRSLADALVETAVTSSVLFLIVLGATFFTYFVTQARIPPTLVEFLGGMGLSPVAVLSLMILFYLVAGCFIDGIGMALATVPVFYPVIVGLGYDPIWFGILLVVLIEFGAITPPVGMNLFVIKSVAPDLKFSALYGGILPFLGALIIMILLLIAFPGLALWLPQVFYG
ncbi:MAG: TRAP transporter large permease [Rhodobacteraceae bacterium]|nr:TRAP transporter large permease [Paracoccaceae bacterium]MBR9821025.1 TRAP transporter large permease [Paracoccaceae bacterium]